MFTCTSMHKIINSNILLQSCMLHRHLLQNGLYRRSVLLHLEIGNVSGGDLSLKFSHYFVLNDDIFVVKFVVSSVFLNFSNKKYMFENSQLIFFKAVLFS